jgi:hypothetical protein
LEFLQALKSGSRRDISLTNSFNSAASYEHLQHSVAMHWATTAMLDGSFPLTTQEALSGVFGSISLASWIFLLVSQASRVRIAHPAGHPCPKALQRFAIRSTRHMLHPS